MGIYHSVYKPMQGLGQNVGANSASVTQSSVIATAATHIRVMPFIALYVDVLPATASAGSGMYLAASQEAILDIAGGNILSVMTAGGSATPALNLKPLAG